MKARAVFHALITSYISHERGRTLLTLLGLALGVAVLVAIDLANESAVSSFKQTVRDVAGSAELSIRGRGAGLPGDVVSKAIETKGVAGAAPLISGRATFYSAEGKTTETLLLLGVDLLLSAEPPETPVRPVPFQLEEGREATSFLINPDVLLFTEPFLKKNNLKLGERITLDILGVDRKIIVGGRVEGGPLIDAEGGNVAVTDVGMADVLLRRGGLLDQVDLLLEEGAEADTVAGRLRDSLPESALVERPETRNQRVDDMLSAFRFNLRALGHISIVVGAFLIYNTMNIAVIRRRKVIGTVRALGVSRGMVRLVFLLEGALFGLAASLIGILAGIAMAAALLDIVATAISINFVETRAERLALEPGIIMLALGMGIGGSLIAAAGPAHEAAATPPANTMTQGAAEGRPKPLLRPTVFGCIFAALGVYTLTREPEPGLPILGYTASLFLIAAFVFWSRPLLTGLCAIFRRPYSRLFKAEGLLAVSSLQASSGRSSVAICGLMISLGMTIAVSVMVSSFRGTVTTWMNQVLLADLYVSPASTGASRRPAPMPRELAEQVEALPGVDSIDPFRSREVLIDGQPALLGAGSLSSARFANQTIDGRDMEEVLEQAKSQGQVVASAVFARKRGLEAGDSIHIPTPEGLQRLVIAGIYHDYSSEKGYVIMDWNLYDQFYEEQLINSISIFVEPGADREKLRRRVLEISRGDRSVPPLSVRANEELRKFALQSFDKTFAITWVLQAIAMTVAVLGVTATLLSQILDRRAEIATLRHLGAGRGRVVRVVLLESGLIGVAGVLMGIVAGIGLSWILTKVIMLQSFGWTITYDLPWLVVAQVSLVVFLATLAGAALPAREAVRTAQAGLRRNA